MNLKDGWIKKLDFQWIRSQPFYNHFALTIVLE